VRQIDRTGCRRLGYIFVNLASFSPSIHFLDNQRSVTLLTRLSRFAPLKSGDIDLAPGGGDVAPKLEPARLAFVFGMAVTILAILTWLSRDLAAPTPPTEPIYQPQHLILY
jgi:hypothetical protein